jgi:polar amino acid transport system substrate-binding protein
MLFAKCCDSSNRCPGAQVKIDGIAPFLFLIALTVVSGYIYTMRALVIFLLTFCFSLPSAMCLAGDIHILGNILPPLKFEKDGRVQGVMVDVLSKMMEEVGQPIDQDVFQIMAWARAYEDAVTIPGSILLGVALTEEWKS